jgi:thiol:disulfide interchange protein
MVEFSTSWCGACKRLDETVFSRADVVEASRDFVAVRVDAEEQADLKEQFRVHSYPTVLFLAPDGGEMTRVLGAVPYQIMLKEMTKAAPGGALSTS